MRASHKITILVGRREVLPSPVHYYRLISHIADCWREMGLEVEFKRGVPSRSHPIDLLFSHIDQTKVHPSYVRYIKRCPRVVNGNILDISKRTISKNLVSEHDAYGGPVIVKTNVNCGGDPGWTEFVSRMWKRSSVALWGRSQIESLHDRVHRLVRPEKKRSMHSSEYPVYDTIGDVPRAVWGNPHLVVERFIPERSEAYYCMRVCFCLGDVILNRRVFSKSKIIKGASVAFSEPAEVPEQLHRIRAEMGLDYVKLDYVLHDGEVHLLDVNKTPGTLGSPEINARIAERLAQGIHRYL